ncbi:unnamed protein product [Ixodes pacificus]
MLDRDRAKQCHLGCLTPFQKSKKNASSNHNDQQLRPLCTEHQNAPAAHRRVGKQLHETTVSFTTLSTTGMCGITKTFRRAEGILCSEGQCTLIPVVHLFFCIYSRHFQNPASQKGLLKRNVTLFETYTRYTNNMTRSEMGAEVEQLRFLRGQLRGQGTMKRGQCRLNMFAPQQPKWVLND